MNTIAYLTLKVHELPSKKHKIRFYYFTIMHHHQRSRLQTRLELPNVLPSNASMNDYLQSNFSGLHPKRLQMVTQNLFKSAIYPTHTLQIRLYERSLLALNAPR